MNPLLVILAHEAVMPIVERHKANHERAGIGRLVVSSLNAPKLSITEYYAEIITRIGIGAEPFTNPNERIERLITVLDCCLMHESHTHFVLAEYDTVFLRNAVIPLTGMAALARTERNWHCPWIFDRDTAAQVRKWASAMLAAGVTNNGHLGYFFHTMSVLYSMPIQPINGYTHIKIGPAEYPEMKEAIRNGAWVVHGIKTEEALKECTS